MNSTQTYDISTWRCCHHWCSTMFYWLEDRRIVVRYLYGQIS